jgi:hypothetical protein
LLRTSGAEGTPVNRAKVRRDMEDESQRLYPTRVLRLDAMVESLLVEVRQMDLDPAACELLTDIYGRELRVLRGALPSDLVEELDDLLPSLQSGNATLVELRMVHAQLHGWLAGLLQGLQLASICQHLDAHLETAERRRASGREVGAATRRDADAAYL